MTLFPKTAARRYALAAIAVLALRLLSLPLYPLTDTTEARYALVARLMADSGDWITPWFASGVPFWGKPPLLFWATGGLMQLFGFGEFTARAGTWIPSALLALLTVVWARRRYGASVANLASLMLVSGVLFFVTSGSVLTDNWLALGLGLIVVGSFECHRSSVIALLTITLGVAIGMLAKGPLVVVLGGPPALLSAWLLGSKRFRAIGLLCLACLLGGLLTVPWYLAAELKTPGFIDYFIVGEHWRRYLEPGWAGDRYGSAHLQPLGKIWLLAIPAFLPWLPLAPLAWRGRREDLEGWLLLAWVLWPALFFTAAHNILSTYLLPSAMPLAVWLSRGLCARPQQNSGMLLLMSSVAPLLLFAAMLVHAFGGFALRSERDLIAQCERFSGPERPVYFSGEPPFSAKLYGGDRVHQLTDAATPPDHACWARRKGEAEGLAGWRPVFEDKRYRLWVRGDYQPAF